MADKKKKLIRARGEKTAYSRIGKEAIEDWCAERKINGDIRYFNSLPNGNGRHIFLQAADPNTLSRFHDEDGNFMIGVSSKPGESFIGILVNVRGLSARTLERLQSVYPNNKIDDPIPGTDLLRHTKYQDGTFWMYVYRAYDDDTRYEEYHDLLNRLYAEARRVDEELRAEK